MPRFFLAMQLPEDAKDRLLAVQPPTIPGVRLIRRQELHLTLHFLGEVAAHDEGRLREALSNVKAYAFPITIQGIGQFPPEGEPQVLWAGVETNPSLIALHHSIGTALAEAIRFQPEERPYSPHVTLARLNMPAPPGVIEQYLEANNGFCVSPVFLKQFALYSSVFVNNVPHYQEESVFHLAENVSSP